MASRRNCDLTAAVVVHRIGKEVFRVAACEDLWEVLSFEGNVVNPLGSSDSYQQNRCRGRRTSFQPQVACGITGL